MVLSKHLINDPSDLVVESLQGLVYLNPHLTLDVKNKVVYKTALDKSQVSLICGGGSGHEPSHAGFVGDGMLTAAVAGNVFASPNATQVTRAIELVDGDKGTLIIVKNYTGDILNFGLAKEQYAAAHPEKSKRVKFLVVGDDVSVGKTQGGLVGRRGLAGTVIVYKIAGALASRGVDLDSVYDVAEWVSQRLGTVGVGLEHCHIPGTTPASSHLSPTSAEIGMGIHNEPGFEQISPIPPLKDLISTLLDLLTSTMDPERSFLPFGAPGSGNDEVVVMVNNLGGISELEISGVAREIVEQLRGRKIGVKRVLVGAFMTSLNMPGFSLTLLLLPRPGEACPVSLSDLLTLLDDKPNVPGWKWSSALPAPAPTSASSVPVPTPSTQSTSTSPKIPAPNPTGFTASIRRAAASLITHEASITSLDNIVGDGDAGLTHKSGAQHVLKALDNGDISGEDVIGSVAAVAQAVGDGMDGTSGALYSIWFSGLVQALRDVVEQEQVKEVTLPVWTKALRIALNKLYTYTRARPPSRTLVDPLAAFVQTLEDGEGLESAVGKAGVAAEATKDLEAKAGRAAYVEREKVKGISDPGAVAVRYILEAFVGK